MSLRDIHVVLETTVICSTFAAFLLTAWVERRPSKAGATRTRSFVRWLFHPLAQLGLVIALLFSNQILFNAYVLRVHHGDPSFIQRYIGEGWFVLAKSDPLVRFVARHAGDGQLLAPSVLRVQAFLELPFVLFAYLSVARMLGRSVARTLCRWPLLAAASISFSITFSLIELSLPNPYTTDDLVLRAIACVLVPPYVAWTAKHDAPERDGAPTSALGLLAFLAGAGAIAYGVLVVYDVFLLYNLGHLSDHAPALGVVSVVAVIAAWAAPRLGHARSPVAGSLGSMLATFTTLFFVPSLSIRYWSPHPSAAACGLLLVAAAGVWGFLRVRKELPSARDVVIVLASLAVGAAAGVSSAIALLLRASHATELLLAEVSIALLAPTIVVACAVARMLAVLRMQSVRR